MRTYVSQGRVAISRTTLSSMTPGRLIFQLPVITGSPLTLPPLRASRSSIPPSAISVPERSNSTSKAAATANTTSVQSLLPQAKGRVTLVLSPASCNTDCLDFHTPFAIGDDDEGSPGHTLTLEEQKALEAQIVREHYWLFSNHFAPSIIQVIGNTTTNVWLMDCSNLPTIIKHQIFDTLYTLRIENRVRYHKGPIYQYVCLSVCLWKSLIYIQLPHYQFKQQIYNWHSKFPKVVLVAFKETFEYMGLVGDDKKADREEYVGALISPGLPFLSINTYKDLNDKWISTFAMILSSWLSQNTSGSEGCFSWPLSSSRTRTSHPYDPHEHQQPQGLPCRCPCSRLHSSRPPSFFFLHRNLTYQNRLSMSA